MSNIRDAVVREIRRKRKSGYEFARALRDLHPQTVMKWLYSGKRVSLAVAERLMVELDLVVVPRSQVKKVKR